MKHTAILSALAEPITERPRYDIAPSVLDALIHYLREASVFYEAHSPTQSDLNRARILRNLARKLSAKRGKAPAFPTKPRNQCSDTPSN